MNYITNIPFLINKEDYLKDFYKNFETHAVGLTDARMKSAKSYFKIIKNTQLLNIETKKWSALLDADARARYYWLKPNRQLWWHVDAGTKCAINFILNDNNSKILFSETGIDLNGPPPKKYLSFTYNSAILDVTKYHSVPNNSKNSRILFKVSIFDKSYEDIVSKIKNMQEFNF